MQLKKSGLLKKEMPNIYLKVTIEKIDVLKTSVFLV